MLVELVLSAFWAALHFWIVPRTKASWIAGDLRAKMARAGVLAVLDKLTEFCLVAAVTLFAIILVVVLLGAWASTGAVAPRRLIDVIASLKEGVKAFAEDYGIFLGVVGLLAGGILLWMAARQARRRVADVWHAHALAEHAAILDDPSLLERIAEDLAWRPRVDEIHQILAALPDEALPEARRQQLQQGLQSLLLILVLDRAARLVDVPELIATVEEAGGRPTGWRGVVAMLASKRFSEDLALIRKPLGKVATGLLFVSLVGWTAAPLADSLRLTVNNLMVNADDADAQRNLDKALSQAEPPPAEASAPPVSAANATRVLARAIVQEMVRSPLLVDAAHLPGDARRDGAAVNRALLSDQMLTVAEPEAAPADAVRREAVVGAGEAGDARLRDLQHGVEERIAPVVERLAHERPGALKAAVAWAQARYGDPIAGGDAIGRLTEAVLDFGADPIDFKPHNEIDKQAQKLAKSFGKKSLQTWVDAHTKGIFADLVRRSVRPEVARELALDLGDNGSSFVADLHRTHDDGWVPSARVADEQEVNSKVANAIVHEADSDPAGEMSRGAGEMLGGYDSIFPARAARAASAAAESAEAIGEGVSAAGQVAGRFADFAFATRSFRARGVVVGRDLAGQLEVSDMRWQLQPAQGGHPTQVAVDLLMGRNGGWRRIGVFDAGTVNQAIRYAADGRVIATTIVLGDGRHIARSTNLHPALIDTPLGCRIVESDRWIDTFTVGRGAPSAWHDREETWAWLRRMKLMEAAAGDGAACRSPELTGLLAGPKMPAPRFSPAYGAALDRFLATRLRNPAGGDAFVKAASACAERDGGAASGCVCGGGHAVGLRSLPESYWFPEDHTSQLRESATSLTPDLRWLTASPDHLGNFDMWVHTTFSLRHEGEGDENRTAAFDFPSSRLQELRQLVKARLPEHLKRELHAPSYDDFMRPLEQFVLFQRLARAALQSRLGPDFPTSKLLALARETRRYVPSQPTVRWDAAEDPKAFLQFLNAADQRAASRYREYEVDVIRRASTHHAICGAASL